jgi:hypothetical protein
VGEVELDEQVEHLLVAAREGVEHVHFEHPAQTLTVRGLAHLLEKLQHLLQLAESRNVQGLEQRD